MTVLLAEITGMADWLTKTINYEIIKGNAIWRFGLVLLVVLAAMATGRIVQFTVKSYAGRRVRKKGEGSLTLLLTVLANPIYVAVFAAGVFFVKIPLHFSDETDIRMAISTGWTTLARVILAIAAAYGLYRLVDVIEYYLNRLVGKTETKLDDMLVPIVHKALRLTITIIAVLLISENILGGDKVKSLMLSAGVGGIAVALAAKDTIANFFGSITIFADRPFQMGELVKIGEHLGPSRKSALEARASELCRAIL
jgi:MscS family membrane protein